MSTSYTEKFNVLEVFEQNPYQKIMMGAHIDNPDDVVVINVFKKGAYLDADFLEKSKSALSNLIHAEENESEAILITDYQEGMSLHAYLDGFDADFETRIGLADTYMSNILKYGVFSNYFKTIFLDDNQIIIQDEVLKLNELIIVDQQIENALAFDTVVSKVTSTLEAIFRSGKHKVLEHPAKDRVDAFLSSLRVNTGVYTTLDALNDAYRNTFIFDVSANAAAGAGLAAAGATVMANVSSDAKETEAAIPSDSLESSVDTSQESVVQKEIELDGLEVVNGLFEESDADSDKKRNGGPLALILIAIALIAAFFAFANPFEKNELKPPLASFVRQEIDEKLHFENTSQAFGKDNAILLSEWIVYAVTEEGPKKLKTANDHHLELIIKNSGTYKVELKVQDQNKQWSEPTSEEFNYTVDSMDNHADDSNAANPQEKLEKYLIEYKSDNVSKDTEVFRSGTESIKMDLSAGEAQISLKNLSVANNSIVSMWVLSDNTDPITVSAKGYKDGQLVFSKETRHVPRAANTWEMVEMKVDGNNADTLVLTYSGTGTIWVDDIDISSFK